MKQVFLVFPIVPLYESLFDFQFKLNAYRKCSGSKSRKKKVHVVDFSRKMFKRSEASLLQFGAVKINTENFPCE